MQISAISFYSHFWNFCPLFRNNNSGKVPDDLILTAQYSIRILTIFGLFSRLFSLLLVINNVFRDGGQRDSNNVETNKMDTRINSERGKIRREYIETDVQNIKKFGSCEQEIRGKCCKKIRGNHYETVSVSTGSLTRKNPARMILGKPIPFPTGYFVPYK